jgi:hypothetical protein
VINVNKVKTALLGLALATPAAFADGGTPGVDVINGLSGNISALATAGFTVLGVLLAATIGMKLVKKFANRAS